VGSSIANGVAKQHRAIAIKFMLVISVSTQKKLCETIKKWRIRNIVKIAILDIMKEKSIKINQNQSKSIKINQNSRLNEFTVLITRPQ
jgi:hypothetical protein